MNSNEIPECVVVVVKNKENETKKNEQKLEIPKLDVTKDMEETKIEIPKAKSHLLNVTLEQLQKIYDVILLGDSALDNCVRNAKVEEDEIKNPIDMKQFLIACEYIYLIFSKIPPNNRRIDGLSRARNDILQNINRLKEKHRNNSTVGFTKVHHAMYWDYLAILWLNRGLEYIAELLKLITQQSNLTLSDCARTAYQNTLKKHHNSVIAMIADMVLKSAPDKKKFLLAVSDELYRDEEMFDLEKSRHGRERNKNATESETVMTILTFISVNIKQLCEQINYYIKIFDCNTNHMKHDLLSLPGSRNSSPRNNNNNNKSTQQQQQQHQQISKSLPTTPRLREKKKKK